MQGYVASRATTGTKTDTPLIETPQSISVITSDQIKAQGAETLAHSLRYTPGVVGDLNGNDNRGYGIQIRGFGDGSDTVFYRNGLPLKGTAFTSFLPLDIYGAEKIEVLRGPASVLYGQGEPSGLINYVSKRPLDKPFHELEILGGNYNHYSGRFDLSGPVNKENTFLYRLTGLYRDTGTQFDYVGENRVFIAPAFTWKLTPDTTLTFLSHYQRDNNGWGIQFFPASGTLFPNPNGKIPSTRFTGEPAFDKYAPTQYSLGYEFEHRFNEAVTFRQNARYANLNTPQQLGVFGAGFQPDMRTYDRYGDLGRSKIGTYAIDNQVQAKLTTGILSHTVLMGVDHQHHDYTDFGAGFDVGPLDLFNPIYGSPVTGGIPYQDTRQIQSQTGVYLSDQIKLDRWVLSLGGRHDWADSETKDRLAGVNTTQKASAFTGRVGLLYASEFGVSPYVSYAQSFLPVLGTGATGAPFVPETGEQYEVGVKFQPNGVNAFVTVAAFDLTRQNVTTTDNDPRFQVQTGEINSRGIEVEAVASLMAGLDLRAAYTYLDTVVTASNDGLVGKTPYAVSRHRLAVWADYTIKSGTLAGFGIGSGVRYNGPSPGDDANTFEVPSSTLVDAAIHYDWQKFRFAINAKNVFDKEYIASCFGATFGCFFGERRKVIASLRYRW